MLDQQLEAGIALLRQAHQAQLRALEMVWMTNPAAKLPRIAAGPAAEPLEASARPPQRGAWELYRDTVDALGKIGPEFTRTDVCRALGYEPNRASLQRTLKELANEGVIELAEEGSGRLPARWRKRPGVEQHKERS